MAFSLAKDRDLSRCGMKCPSHWSHAVGRVRSFYQTLRECWMWKTPFCVVNSLQSHWRGGKRKTFFVECCQRLRPVWVSSLVFTNLAAWSYALFSLRGLEWYFIQHTPIELTDWSCREWRHVQQTQDDSTFGKAAGAGSEEPWKKRSPFSHLCNVFLMYSKWQPNYTHCKFGACFHRWIEFAFSWRTGKQRPRVVHTVTITCLHCKYSFELQRRQAEDPRVVHAMTLAPANFSWRTDREGAHGLGPIWQQPSCTQVRFGVGEKTIEGGHGAYMQWPARTLNVDVCFHWRTVKQSSRVKHAVPQQPVDSNLLALQIFFELQRRQVWEPRVVHSRGVHAMTATWVVEKRAEKPQVVDAMTLTFTIEVFFQLKNWQRGSGPGSYKKW